jgi:hypothetical protein
VAEDDPYHSQPPRRRLTRVTSNRWAEPAMPNHVGRVRQHREAELTEPNGPVAIVVLRQRHVLPGQRFRQIDRLSRHLM